jgi:hypothetical protein
MSTYNGWTNYATWRVNLEIFDGVSTSDLGFDGMPLSGLTGALKEYVEEIVCPFKKGENSLAETYALAFVSEVNWSEIAKHLKEDEEQDEPSDEDRGVLEQAAWHDTGAELA